MQAFERFTTAVRLGTGLDREAAERTAQAVLTTLFERLSGGQADDIAQRLKPPGGFVEGALTLRNRPADRFEFDEFLRRVAEREHVDRDVARAHSSAVLNALRLVLPKQEWADTVAQLPGEFERLLAEPWRPRRPLLTSQGLLELVAERGGLAVDGSRRITEGVLAALAQRLPDEAVAELVRRLPDELHPALERGLTARTAPRRLDLDDFLALIAERTGDPEQARRYAATVLQVLAEALDDLMLVQLLEELPDDYADLFVPAGSRTG